MDRPGIRPGDRPGSGGVRPPIRPPIGTDRPGIGGGGDRPVIRPPVGPGGGDRPVIRPPVGPGGGDRPTVRPPSRPTPLPIERPGIRPDRPGTGSGDRPIVNRPEINRPIINRPTINRPTINRPTINKPINNTVITGGTTINNTVVNNINNSFGNTINVSNFNRPWVGYHDNWYHGSWGGRWDRIPSFWLGYGFGRRDGFWEAAAVGIGLAALPVFYNPYYIAPPPPTILESPAVTVVQTFDYSQPIVIPSQAEQQEVDRDITQEAMDRLAEARKAFKNGLYSTARSRVEAGLKLLPGDTTMHEFRALTFFAEKKYTDAAGGLYAVLAAGPGMDWSTMASLYPDQETYTRQLRALEEYVKANPKSGEGHFVLAYHYLVLGENDAAANEFAAAVDINPKDELSASFYQALTAPPDPKE